MSDRQKLALALLASALIHVAIGLILALRTETHTAEVAERAKPDLSQLTVTIMPPKPPPTAKAPPELAMEPTPPPVRPDLDSDGLTKASTPPPHALFQSDSNMHAGSLLPATGNIPLPSMSGQRRKFMDFANSALSVGKGQAPSQAARARQAAAAAAAAARALPAQSPSAVTQVHTSATPAPKPAEVAQATPTPTPRPTPPDSLALGTPTPKPSPTPAEQFAKLNMQPSLRAHADMAPNNSETPTLPSPERPPTPSQPEPSTQRQTERTHIDGGITNPGAPGVDAVETPFGRYHRKLSALIGSRWQLYEQEHHSDIGDVTILVELNTNGKVAGTRVVSNHSNDDLAGLSTRAIMESDLPPVPDDLAPMLRDGKLEIEFNFTVYDPENESPPGR